MPRGHYEFSFLGVPICSLFSFCVWTSKTTSNREQIVFFCKKVSFCRDGFVKYGNKARDEFKNRRLPCYRRMAGKKGKTTHTTYFIILVMYMFSICFHCTNFVCNWCRVTEVFLVLLFHCLNVQGCSVLFHVFIPTLLPCFYIQVLRLEVVSTSKKDSGLFHKHLNLIVVLHVDSAGLESSSLMDDYMSGVFFSLFSVQFIQNQRVEALQPSTDNFCLSGYTKMLHKECKNYCERCECIKSWKKTNIKNILGQQRYRIQKFECINYSSNWTFWYYTCTVILLFGWGNEEVNIYIPIFTKLNIPWT